MKFQDLLSRELAPLGHFIGEYFEAKTDLDAFNIVIEKILPYIFTSPLIAPNIKTLAQSATRLRKDYAKKAKALHTRTKEIIESLSVAIEADRNNFLKSVQQFISVTDDYVGHSSIADDFEKAKAFNAQLSRYNLYRGVNKSVT